MPRHLELCVVEKLVWYLHLDGTDLMKLEVQLVLSVASVESVDSLLFESDRERGKAFRIELEDFLPPLI